ncbi:fructose 1,6-bisphosphatase [Methylobacterium sp. Leaf456]|uniref:class 1 fructose-bisphosphatase n=1 Tax=Methylobacterium sp. Leaf456 TaxID=1736382 RepID=UPI000701A8D4|nr:class 1 fructose-bisphosphatase [Methylobacterium sp. Leaf456]KQT46688.1 fructose 1,6-bisphosphatase [Methylobacterium sp. Leaf456]
MTKPTGSSLDAFLDAEVARDATLADTAATIRALSAAAIDVSETCGRGALAGDMGAQGEHNSDGDVQKALDVIAHKRFMQALEQAPVAEVASEEADDVVVLNLDAPLAVAIDPLDGSSNIAVGMVVGTIFGIRPKVVAENDPNASFKTPGTTQTAAGFVVYGPATTFVLTLGNGTRIFTLERTEGVFLLTHDALKVVPSANEYAINASNARHWDGPIKAFIEDCQRGTDGPRDRDFNMRWTAALVADAQRVLIRGGVFLYPGDSRKGYGQGRLRLLYETAPMAFLMEQAGAAATDGRTRVLDLVATKIHERSPLVFGSTDEVAAVTAYYDGRQPAAGRSPLFGQRGLMRS